jgi:hypothetical protein
MRLAAYWIPVLLSFVVAPICLVIAVAYAGMGHGSYLWALIFFPYTMLSTRFFGSIPTFFALLAIAQFPIYGFILGSANVKGRFRRTALILLTIHVLTIGIMWGASLYQPRDYVFLEAIRTNDTKTVKQMLDKGMDPNTHNSADTSALDLACYNGNIEIADLLISKGADINYQDRYLGNTPLIMAVISGQEQCVQLLVSRGADIQRKDLSGYTALDRAKQYNNAKNIYLLESAERSRRR